MNTPTLDINQRTAFLSLSDRSECNINVVVFKPALVSFVQPRTVYKKREAKEWWRTGRVVNLRTEGSEKIQIFLCFGAQGKRSLQENEFSLLASQWYKDTRKCSVASQIVMHPAYQKIIGMGRDALPYIFKELHKTRGHWLWALAMIYRKDIGRPGQNFREAVDSWLEFGRQEGFL